MPATHVAWMVAHLLLRLADWSQGAYFYEIYESKVPSVLSAQGVSNLFIVGFLTSAVAGTFVGTLVDR